MRLNKKRQTNVEGKGPLRREEIQEKLKTSRLYVITGGSRRRNPEQGKMHEHQYEFEDVREEISSHWDFVKDAIRKERESR